jgi:tRNA pseudouridine55 synthase
VGSAAAAHGVLVIDKPEGPTSHDVVGRVRRVLGERRVGHAGTLDPLATGVVVVVVGGATRLAAYLTSDDKRYRATIRFGIATATYDREGTPLGDPRPVPAELPAAVTAALAGLAGTRPQTPPSYSAKKIDGERAHRLARRGEAVTPAPAVVTLRDWRLVGHDGDTVTIDLETSAGFYVRSLAHDLGAALGCGAHLAALRRTGSGAFRLDDAVPLPPADAPASALASHLRPMDALLGDWPAAVVTASGADRVAHGALVGPDMCTVWPASAGPGFAEPGFGAASPPASAASPPRDAASPPRDASSRIVGPSVRLLDAAGRLLALGAWRDGRLHPSVVLRSGSGLEL